MDCIAIQCPAKPQYSHCSGDTGARAGELGRAAGAGVGVGGRARRWAQARRQGAEARRTAGRAGVGARPGLAKTVHSVHPT